MALLVFGLFALVVMPFFALGVKRLWLVAAFFWVPLAVFAAYVWMLPVDPAEDEQMASLWRMILLGVAVTGPIAFAGGMITALFAASHSIDLEEKSE